MRSKFPLLVLLLILPASLLGRAWALEFTCIKNGEIKILFDAEVTVEKASYCTNKDGNILISENCHRKNCTKQLKPVKFDLDREVDSGIGTPGFTLCRMMGGKPEIIEFKLNEQWLGLDRCLFEPERTFIDTGYLYQLNLEKN